MRHGRADEVEIVKRTDAQRPRRPRRPPVKPPGKSDPPIKPPGPDEPPVNPPGPQQPPVYPPGPNPPPVEPPGTGKPPVMMCRAAHPAQSFSVQLRFPLHGSGYLPRATGLQQQM